MDASIRQKYYDLYKVLCRDRGCQPLGDIGIFYSRLSSGTIPISDLPLYWNTAANTKTRQFIFHLFRSNSCRHIYGMYLEGAKDPSISHLPEGISAGMCSEGMWYGTHLEGDLGYESYADFERTKFLCKYKSLNPDTNIVTYFDGTTELCHDIKLPECQEQLKALEGWQHLDRVISIRPKNNGCTLVLQRASPLLNDIYGR